MEGLIGPQFRDGLEFLHKNKLKSKYLMTK